MGAPASTAGPGRKRRPHDTRKHQQDRRGGARLYRAGRSLIEIRLPRPEDAAPCADLAATVIGQERAGPFITSNLECQHLIVADSDEAIVGFLAYRTDWFQCTLVTLVVVREDFRRKGIAREFFRSVEVVAPTPRVFSSTEETNVGSIRMHTALGFTPSGYIDNLPQGTRELLFYRRTPPRGSG